MGENPGNQPIKRICVGLLAHVDAGKTTLSEGLLYACGCLKKLGRVDHQNAFLDTETLERERGITIFSKQAILPMEDMELTLLDTPGHVDFSSEMERTLQVLDCAVLVISGTDGVQGHTRTLWRLLERCGVPTFLFVNKMDLAGADREALLAELKSRLDDACTDFGAEERVLWENAALCDEAALGRYLESGRLSEEDLADLVGRRKVFPCYFGSALKLDGVEELLRGLGRYAPRPAWPEPFGAKVYKIARDAQGNRLTYLKVTGGSLRVKASLAGTGRDGGRWEEKVNQIRLYSGAKFRMADEAVAGTVCAVTGLSRTYPGEGLGAETASEPPVLEPVLTYQVLLGEGGDPHTALGKLRELEEEDPQLRVTWDGQHREIHIQLMGEIQLEILKRLIAQRFGMEVSFGAGSIVYRETIAAPVEGVGHYEPLRHYAEVHLLLEPGERGSGLAIATACSEDQLDRNWQRLILTHLAEREHPGVLTGAPVTDLKFTLVAGRGHLKHTEGGDFRQATYRAVRQGLMQAESILLEPWYDFRLEVPAAQVGRAMADLERMGGEASPPETDGERTVLAGRAPVNGLRGYGAEVTAYTKGQGRLECTPGGYEACRSQDEVAAALGYDPERDVENPADSVFCAHGAGFTVKWDRVREYMHVDSGLRLGAEEPPDRVPEPAGAVRTQPGSLEQDEELRAIYERTYGPIKPRAFQNVAKARSRELPEKRSVPDRDEGPEYLLVDGYNILFAWEGLKPLAQEDLGAARQALMDVLADYRAFRRCEVILVFDAYKVPHGVGELFQYHNIYVVYTKEAETADAYIEKATYALAKRYRVRVATSDGPEQLIILGHGALRLSAGMLEQEIAQAKGQMEAILKAQNRYEKGRAMADAMERALGQKGTEEG